jgi:hypothetical protein
MNTYSSKIAINMLKMTYARMLLRKHFISPSSKAISPLNNGHEGDLSSDESSDPEQHEPLQREIKFTYESVSRYFDMALPDAARELRISCKSLKLVCSRLGIDPWPYNGSGMRQGFTLQSERALMASEAIDTDSHMEMAYPHEASCPNKMRARRSSRSNHSLMHRSQAQPDFAELGLNGILRVSGITAELDAFDMSALNADVGDEMMKSDEQDRARACKEISTDLSTADFLRLLPTDSKGLPTWPRSEGPHARRGRAIAQQTHKRIMPDSDSDSDFEDRETSAKSKHSKTSKQSKTPDRLKVRAL